MDGLTISIFTLFIGFVYVAVEIHRLRTEQMAGTERILSFLDSMSDSEAKMMGRDTQRIVDEIHGSGETRLMLGADDFAAAHKEAGNGE